MDIEKLKLDRASWMNWKDIKPLREEIDKLKDYTTSHTLGDTITIDGDLPQEQKNHIANVAKMMMPWRKGPFKLFDTLIESEWNSNLKYNLLEPYFDLKDKMVADVGCNNGYYMFRFLEQKPKEIIGFDPSPICKTQFDFINHFVKSEIVYELLGIEHIEFYPKKFDTIFCLGVLYHRSDPIGALKSLKKSLNKNGELFLDTFIIDGDEDIALTPKDRYSKIPNIYFIPTVNALKNWCIRAGFKQVELLEVKTTTNDEQRKTDWIKGDSLESFLDKSDQNYTVEGYPAPKRAYIRAFL